MTIIEKIVAVLRDAPRLGAEKDEPEGMRYIQISDTLATMLGVELAEFSSFFQEALALWYRYFEADMLGYVQTSSQSGMRDVTEMARRVILGHDIAGRSRCDYRCEVGGEHGARRCALYDGHPGPHIFADESIPRTKESK